MCLHSMDRLISFEKDVYLKAMAMCCVLPSFASTEYRLNQILIGLKINKKSKLTSPSPLQLENLTSQIDYFGTKQGTWIWQSPSWKILKLKCLFRFPRNFSVLLRRVELLLNSLFVFSMELFKM